MVSENPEVPASVLEEAWKEAGVGEGKGGAAKEAAVNENRAGRYKKKRFV